MITPEAMTVGDLIRQLSGLDPNFAVEIVDYESAGQFDRLPVYAVLVDEAGRTAVIDVMGLPNG